MSDLLDPFKLETQADEGFAARIEPTLVIDDSSVVRKIVRRLLNQLGVNNVFELESISKLQGTLNDQIRLIICDIEMKPITGIQFLTALRKDPGLKGIPVILMTGSMKSDYAIAAKSLKAEAFLLKPFDAKKLKATIERVITFQR